MAKSRTPKPEPRNPTLAILAGGGQLPSLLAAAAHASGWPTHLVTFAGQPQPEGFCTPLAGHETFNIAAVGAILAHLKSQRVSHIVFGGNLVKPSLFRLRPDAKGLLLLPRLRHFHDDHILRTVTGFLREEGFTVLPVTDLLPGLKAPLGALGKHKPAKADLTDIALAMNALTQLGRLDIGQAAVVHKGTIIGVEAAEGTDALIARCAPLRGELAPHERAGWLVKAAKPGQTDLADLPAVGPATVQLLSQYNYKGLAVQAGKTLLIDQPALTAAADQSGLILLGIE